jgi:hypothetical protein
MLAESYLWLTVCSQLLPAQRTTRISTAFESEHQMQNGTGSALRVIMHKTVIKIGHQGDIAAITTALRAGAITGNHNHVNLMRGAVHGGIPRMQALQQALQQTTAPRVSDTRLDYYHPIEQCAKLGDQQSAEWLLQQPDYRGLRYDTLVIMIPALNHGHTAFAD